MLLLLDTATALHALLVSGDGTAAAQCLADMASEVQRMEPNNAALMVQLVSRSSTVLLSACCGPLCCALLRLSANLFLNTLPELDIGAQQLLCALAAGCLLCASGWQ